MTLTANSNGVITGHFTIPANIPAGSKSVIFTGAGGSKASATFVGSGKITDQVLRSVVTNYYTRYYDPVAQTFTTSEDCQIGAVDLLFNAKGTTDVLVQIRDSVNGFPGTDVLAEAILAPAQILTNGARTRFSFPAPVALKADIMYAVVVACNDAVSSVGFAQIGEFDSVNQTWVTAQPYQVGTMFTSSNGTAWSVSQDRDLTFILQKAVFTSNTRTVALGTVAVTAATDLMLLTLEEKPSSNTYISYALTMPDGSVLPASNEQSIQLASAVTGNITISATLHGTASASPVLVPGAQLVVGQVGTTGTYITPAITGGASIKIKCVFDAYLPAGSNVVTEYQKVGDNTWTSIPNVSSVPVGNGVVTLTNEVTGVNAPQVRVRFTLTGTTAARPLIQNLRFMTI